MTLLNQYFKEEFPVTGNYNEYEKINGNPGSDDPRCNHFNVLNSLFDRFPYSEKEKQRWITAIRIFTAQQIESVERPTNLRICGKHFRTDELQITGNKLCLKKGAVPSVFTKTQPYET